MLLKPGNYLLKSFFFSHHFSLTAMGAMSFAKFAMVQSYRIFTTLLIPFLKSSTLKWISIPPLHSNNLRKLSVGAQWISFKDSTDLTLIADLLTHGPLRALCLSHSAL